MSGEARGIIPPEQWVWHGIPAHFICATRCDFRMATTIGDVIVSTVGGFVPGTDDDDGYEQIGADRLYETMVFAVGGICDCGCGMARIDVSRDLDFAGYNTKADAHAGHMAMCRKWAGMEGTVTDVR